MINPSITAHLEHCELGAASGPGQVDPPILVELGRLDRMIGSQRNDAQPGCLWCQNASGLYSKDALLGALRAVNREGCRRISFSGPAHEDRIIRGC
jgi:hypothetical protein